MNDPRDLTGRVAVVAGAGKGMGLAISQRMHAYGAVLIGLDTQPDPARSEPAFRDPARAILKCDVSREAEVIEALRQVETRFGGIDILVNTAVNASPHPEEVWRVCEQMHPLGRVGTANEVAELCAHLASDAAGFCTGQAFRIDGGLGITITASMRCRKIRMTNDE